MRKKHESPHLLRGVLPLDKRDIGRDILAGITLAAIAIPIDMGYAKIAGMPVVSGLYVLFLPVVLFALFGASRHLVVGADSATAAILASALAGFASVASPEYVGYAGLLTLLAAAILFLFRVCKLGFISHFLSRTVLIGFLTGVGVQVSLGQFGDMVGLSGLSGNAFEKLRQAISGFAQWSPYAIALSLGILLLMVGTKWLGNRFKSLQKIPWALIGMAAAIALSYWGNFSSSGVAVVGDVSAGLPRFVLPVFSIDAAGKLLGAAFTITIVIVTQSAATAESFGNKHGEKSDVNRDIVGLAAANAAAAFTGAFVVNGSPTKTEVADSAGACSQMANLTAAAVVGVVLLFFTGPLEYLPLAALASMVFITGIGLINIAGLRRVFRIRKIEFFIAVVTGLVVVVLGTAQGILFAIIFSLIDHIYRSYHPQNMVLCADEDRDTHWVPVQTGVTVRNGVVVYLFAHSLYYANAGFFLEELELLMNQEPKPKGIVIDFSAVSEVDFTAGETVADACREINARGIPLKFVLVRPELYRQLEKCGVMDLVGKENVYNTLISIEQEVETLTT